MKERGQSGTMASSFIRTLSGIRKLGTGTFLTKTNRQQRKGNAKRNAMKKTQTNKGNAMKGKKRPTKDTDWRNRGGDEKRKNECWQAKITFKKQRLLIGVYDTRNEAVKVMRAVGDFLESVQPNTLPLESVLHNPVAASSAPSAPSAPPVTPSAPPSVPPATPSAPPSVPSVTEQQFKHKGRWVDVKEVTQNRNWYTGITNAGEQVKVNGKKNVRAHHPNHPVPVYIHPEVYSHPESSSLEHGTSKQERPTSTAQVKNTFSTAIPTATTNPLFAIPSIPPATVHTAAAVFDYSVYDRLYT